MSSTDSAETLIVLDVDRTMINGTAWPRLLRSDLSPLDARGRAEFERLDQLRYHAAAPIDDREYRDDVLALLDLSAGSSTKHVMSGWGRSIVSQMHIYATPIELIRALLVRQSSTRVVFLSAGWQWFMQGVVEGILDRSGMTDLDAAVIGSTLCHDGTSWRSLDLVDGAAKSTWINARLDEGFHVALLADDQHHDVLPFDRIAASGGRVYRLGSCSGESDPWVEATGD